MDKLKTFDDLVFMEFDGEWYARMDFSNGWGISVVLGKRHYSNGVDTYEIGILRGEDLSYPNPIYDYDSVEGNLTREEVTDAMIKLQKAKDKRLFN